MQKKVACDRCHLLKMFLCVRWSVFPLSLSWYMYRCSSHQLIVFSSASCRRGELQTSYTYSDDDNWISAVSKEAHSVNEIRFTVSERPRAHTSIHSFLSLRCDKEVVKLFKPDSHLCIRATITCIQTLPFISWLCWDIIPLNWEKGEQRLPTCEENLITSILQMREQSREDDNMPV